ncbi:hypothetical protein D3C73_1456830 [compost metagenome]
MLLSGLKSEHEAALPVRIHGLSYDPAWNTAHQCLRYGEEAAGGTAEGGGNAEGLCVADYHIGSQLARRLQEPQRQRVNAHDKQGLGSMNLGLNSPDIL